MAIHTNHDLNLKELKHLPAPTSVHQSMLASGAQMVKVLDGMILLAFTTYIKRTYIYMHMLFDLIQCMLYSVLRCCSVDLAFTFDTVMTFQTAV